jgi:hypothetical protein
LVGLLGCRSSFNPLSFTAIKLAFTVSLFGFQNWFISYLSMQVTVRFSRFA